MKAFEYVTAQTLAAASGFLAKESGAAAKCAGTDVLDLLKERILEPATLVNLGETAREAGADEIPAQATLAEIAADERIAREFPALHQAAAEAATPQIRNFGTLGGNLCQYTRCWYFRTKSFPCLKRGGDLCAAREKGAQNRYHALFYGDGCVSAHSSSLAPVLVALGARIACVHPDGGRTMDAELLYRQPEKGRLEDTVLRPGELIRAVVLKPSALARNSTYVEFRERGSFDFAVASVAAAVEMEKGVVKDARIVLGAVAPTPYRARAAEKALIGKTVDFRAASEAAVTGAKPLEKNRFKVPIARRLVERALKELCK